MRKIKYKKGKRLQPFTLEYTGPHKNKEVELQLFVYNDCTIEEYEDAPIDYLEKHIDLEKINWLNIHGLSDINLLKKIADHFSIDDFMLADILNTTKRTKLEEEKDVLFFNIKSMLPREGTDEFKVEQISFLLKKGILISFQEKRSDFFTHIRERIRTHSGIVRTKKADYLLYILLDSIIGNFYITIENEENKVEDLIDLTKNSADPIILEKIETHRDNFNFLKRAIIPLRDSLYEIKSIQEDDVFNEIEADNFSFFTRLHHKCLELLEQIESDMGSLESASNFYFAAQSHKMNEIMKTLTVISAIFIPLTFIVGVYGMNFDNMPELRYHNGYYIVVGFMFLVVIGMVFYFKRRRWF
jgi:magnesium transporter